MSLRDDADVVGVREAVAATRNRVQAAILRDYTPANDDGIYPALAVEEQSLAALNSGEVRVQAVASPIHPADLTFLQGRYGVRRPLPCVPGMEGCGIVVEAGANVAGDLVGKRVAFLAGEGGSWASRVPVPAINCFPIPDAIPDEQAALLLINPLTAWALAAIAQDEGSFPFIQTAAGSALGVWLARLAALRGIETVNIVRRDDHIPRLQAAGAKYVLNSNEPTFDKHLRELCRTLHISLAFDAVGGEMTGRLLRALRDGGRVVLYGGLDSAPTEIGIDQLVFRNKRVEGFWLARWWTSVSEAVRQQAWQEVLAVFDETVAAPIRARYPLAQLPTAVKDAARMSGGKVLLLPGE